jgi:hypothetical protein
MQALWKFAEDGKLDEDQTSVSVLGSIFGTPHHRSVVRLTAQVWCPQEKPRPTPADELSDSRALSEKSEAKNSGPESLARCYALLVQLSEKQRLQFEEMLIKVVEQNKKHRSVDRE